MVEHVEIYELAWFALASITVLGCVMLLIESIRDARTVRRRGIFGPLRIIAESSVRGAVLRLGMSSLLLVVATFFLLHPTPQYLSVPQLRPVPYLVACATALMALNVMLDNRCRTRIREYLRKLDTPTLRRRMTDTHDLDNGTTGTA